MNIAIIGSAYPFRGGLAAYNERLARELIREGHTVTLYTFTLQYPSFLFPGKTQLSEDPAPEGINIVECINSINPFNWIRVGNKIRKTAPDLVIIKYWLPFMGPCFGTILRRIKKNTSTRVVCIVDNIIPHEARIGDTAFTHYFVKPVDAFVAMSQNVLENISKFDTLKPRLFSPHPIFDNFGAPVERNTALASLGLDSSYLYLLFFGLIRDYKGLDLLIEAFSDARFRTQKVKLIIAGEYYSDKHVYKALIEQHKLSNDIIEVDRFIPDSEVATYFSACDLVVQPYKSATQSGVTQIAYHFEKPMILTNVGGLGELCPNGLVGYTVHPNKEEIADAIYTFLTTHDHPFIDNIRAEKQKYSWSKLVETIYTLERTIQR